MSFGKTFVRLLRLSVFVGTACALHASVVFTFDADPIGQSTPFTDTRSGISATFSSSGDVFLIDSRPNFFSFSQTGHILIGPPALVTLTISFSLDVTSVSLNFGTVTPDAFHVNAFETGVLLGSTSATGAVQPPNSFPEGIIGFSGVPFNSITLTTAAPGFAIDNLSADPVPEPGSLCLLAGAALFLLGFRRRLRS